MFLWETGFAPLFLIIRVVTAGAAPIGHGGGGLPEVDDVHPGRRDAAVCGAARPCPALLGPSIHNFIRNIKIQNWISKYLFEASLIFFLQIFRIEILQFLWTKKNSVSMLGVDFSFPSKNEC